MKFLPKNIKKSIVPPIKCQGIKTKLVPFIAREIHWDGKGRWIEPFLGSGVVLFNINPDRALVADTNKHIIKFYKDIQYGVIDENIVKDFLYNMGAELEKYGLEKYGADFYYDVRKKFNSSGGSLQFLFLNRSCFNGLMRFNSKGDFNVPFGRKPDRFRQAYITKICNQISTIKKLIIAKDWEFEAKDWKEILQDAKNNDFVYLDPPYIGRHADYYNNWLETDAVELSKSTKKLKCGFALSMWKKNKYRNNYHLDEYWKDLEEKTISHFYHIGSTENLRNEIQEALIIHPHYVTGSHYKKAPLSIR